MDELAAEVHPVWIVRIHRNGRVPIVAELDRIGVVRLDVRHGPRGDVEAVDIAPLRHRVGHVRVAGHRHDIEAIAEADLLPILVADAVAVPHVGGRLPRPVVLQAAVDVVRHVVVDVDVIELADGQVVDEGPGLSTIAADVDAPVVSVEDEIRIVRVLVPGVVVRVRPAVGKDDLKRPSPVGAFAHHAVEVEQAIGILWIGVNLGIIERPVADVLGGHEVPILAAVGGLVQAGLLGFDEGVDDVRVGRAHRQAHPAELTARQALVLPEAVPIVPAVMGHVQAAALTAGGEEPRLAVEGPHGREQLVGIARVHDHLGTTRGVVDGEHVVPSLASVPRAEHAALGVRTPGRAHRGHEDRLRVGRMDPDAVDGAGVLEAHHAPGRPAVDRAVDAASGRVAVARVALACTGPEDVRIGRRHRHRADAQNVLVIEEGLPRGSAGGAPPEPATGRPGIDDVPVGRVHGQRGDAAAHRARTNVPDRVVLKGILGEARRQTEQGRTEKQEQKTEGVELVHRRQDTALTGAHGRSGEQGAGRR